VWKTEEKDKVEEKKPLLRLGETVPDFEAVTTHGKIKLSDFKGKWVILFSHPADFTPRARRLVPLQKETSNIISHFNCYSP